jgi:hypothetical protein
MERPEWLSIGGVLRPDEFLKTIVCFVDVKGSLGTKGKDSGTNAEKDEKLEAYSGGGWSV